MMNNNFKENYKLTLSQAKENKEYKFTGDNKHTFQSMINKYKENTSDNVMFVLTLGSVDIELTILENGTDKLDIGYVVCSRTTPTKEDDGWETYDYSDKEVLESDFDNIEETMFNELMKYAEKHNLYWSKYNG